MRLKNPLEHFIAKARAKHGDKFDYSLVDYKGAKIKVIIICPVHGQTMQTPFDHHKKIHGCRRCSYENDKKYDHVAAFKSRLSQPTESGCIEWLGHTTKKVNGYGVIGYNHGHKLTHRFAWELVHGEIPKGLFVLHKCDNRICVNVEHLFLGTLKDNAIDMFAKGRGHITYGEDCHNAKLNEKLVLRMREYYKRGFSQTDIRFIFNLPQTTVQKVVNKLTWKHI